MRTVDAVPRSRGTNILSKTDTHDTLRIRFPVKAWLDAYPDCVIQVIHRRSQDPDGLPAAVLETDGTYAYWLITDSDTAYAGDGEAELRMQSGTAVSKSETYDTHVVKSVGSGTGPAPEPVERVAEQIAASAAEAVAAKNIAVDAKETAVEAKNESVTAANRAEAAAGAAETASTHGPTISEDGTWLVWDAAQEQYVDTGVIAEGHDGQDGQDGSDGISPEVTFSTIEGGHSMTVTDREHPDGQTITIMDGADGEVPIDDTTPAADKVFSSAKVSSEITTINQAKVGKDSMLYLESEHVISENLYNVDDVQVGMVTKQGTYPSYTNHRYVVTRGLTPGSVVKMYYVRNGAITAGSFYIVTPKNAQGVVDEEHYATNTAEYTVPSGADTITFCFSGAKGSDEDRTTMIVANGFTPREYIPYVNADVYKATNEFLPVVDFEHLPEGTEAAIAVQGYFHRSPNMFNKDTQLEGYYVNQGNGTLAQGSNYTASDWISVKPSTDYLITHSDSSYTALRYALYDSNKSFISGALGQNALTTGETAEYIRFSFNSNRTQVQLQEGSVALPYEPFGQVYIKNEHLPPDIQTKEFDINVPDKLYALVGQELNVYFDCLVDTHDTDYTFNVDGIGMQLEKCWRIVPTSDQVGSSTLTFTATNKDGKSVTKESTLIVSPTNAGNGKTKKIIILGDSTTANGIAVTKLNLDFSEDVMSVQTLGTRGTAPNSHEGRSGWTFYAYLNTAVDSGDPTVVNPFYNPSTHTFDADYYFTNSGIEKPDWFIVNLGINDTFGQTSDEQEALNIETVIGRCDTVLASVHSAAPDSKIGIALTIPPNYSQDAFGKAYGVGQTRMRYKRNNFMWVKRLMEEYGDRENEGIYLIPIFTNLDTEHNMGMEDMQYNARNSDTYRSPIGNGGVHPVESGYWQIADVYWYFLKAHTN